MRARVSEFQRSTAHDEAEIRERRKSAGVIAYLAKPVPQAVALFAAIEGAGSDEAVRQLRPLPDRCTDRIAS